MIEYQIHYDENYIVELMKRYRTQNQTKILRIFIKAFCFIFLATLACFTIYIKKYMATLMVSPFIILLLVSPWLDYALSKRRIKKSRLFNDTIKFSISSEGCKAISSHSNSQYDWHCITNATRLKDGVILFFSKTQLIWLPDSLIKTGSVNQLNDIIKSNVLKLKYA